MFKSLSPLLLVGLLFAGLASAQPAVDSSDAIGIFFDEAATTPNLPAPMLYQPNTTYLVLCNMSADGIAGWECRVDVEVTGLTTVTGWAHRGSCIILEWMPPNFICPCPPGPAADAVVLMDITFFYTGDEVRFYVSPIDDPLVPGQISYWVDYEVTDVRAMYPTSGSFDLPVACAGCEDVVSTRGGTWGAVKVLYR